MAAVPVALLETDWQLSLLFWVGWQTLPYVSLALAVLRGVERGRATAAILGVTSTAIVGYLLVAAAPADEAFLLAIFLPIVLLPLAQILLRVEWSA